MLIGSQQAHILPKTFAAFGWLSTQKHRHFELAESNFNGFEAKRNILMPTRYNFKACFEVQKNNLPNRSRKSDRMSRMTFEGK